MTTEYRNTMKPFESDNIYYKLFLHKYNKSTLEIIVFNYIHYTHKHTKLENKNQIKKHNQRGEESNSGS